MKNVLKYTVILAALASFPSQADPASRADAQVRPQAVTDRVEQRVDRRTDRRAHRRADKQAHNKIHRRIHNSKNRRLHNQAHKRHRLAHAGK